MDLKARSKACWTVDVLELSAASKRPAIRDARDAAYIDCDQEFLEKCGLMGA